MAITNPKLAQNMQQIAQHYQQGQQNMAGGLGGNALVGLGSGYFPSTNISTTTEEALLHNKVHALETELRAQQSIRKMDQVLLRRHYRIWAWLKDTHPEVIEEFEAVEDLLKASGEEF